MAAEKPPKDPSREQYLKVIRPRDTCLLCNEPLNVDGRHASSIQSAGKYEVIRKDFCPKCWGRMGEKGYFSFWITKRVNAPSAAQRRLERSERNEALWRLFAALYASESEFRPQLFLLAHLLMKYRVLQFSGPTPDGKLRFLHPKLAESFIIEDIQIDSVDFATIHAELEQQAIAYAPQENEENGDSDEPPTKE